MADTGSGIVEGVRVNGAIREIALHHRALAGVVLGQFGLHPGHEAVLFALEADGPLTQADLARAAECEPPSITSMVRKLESAGLVSRRASTSDARAKVVALTDPGREAMHAIHAAWDEFAVATVQAADSVPFEQLVAMLEALAQGLRALRHGA